MKERLESLISGIGVRFTPAFTRGILRPFPRRMHRHHRFRVSAARPHREALTHTSTLAGRAIRIHFQRPGHLLACLRTTRCPPGSPPNPVCRTIHGPPQGRKDLYHRGSWCRDKSLHSPPQAGVVSNMLTPICFTTGNSFQYHDSLRMARKLSRLPGGAAVLAWRCCGRRH